MGVPIRTSFCLFLRSGFEGRNPQSEIQRALHHHHCWGQNTWVSPLVASPPLGEWQPLPRSFPGRKLLPIHTGVGGPSPSPAPWRNCCGSDESLVKAEPLWSLLSSLGSLEAGPNNPLPWGSTRRVQQPWTEGDSRGRMPCKLRNRDACHCSYTCKAWAQVWPTAPLSSLTLSILMDVVTLNRVFYLRQSLLLAEWL